MTQPLMLFVIAPSAAPKHTPLKAIPIKAPGRLLSVFVIDCSGSTCAQILDETG